MPSQTFAVVEEKGQEFLLEDEVPIPPIAAVIATEVEEETLFVPDGGIEAWLVVMASFLIHAATIGIIASFGVWQSYYVNNPQSYDGSHQDVAISCIGSIANSGIGTYGVPSGLFANRYGYKTASVLSGLGLCMALVLSSFATQYWQLLLTQGLLISIFFPLSFFPAVNIISQWWSERKGLALGIATAGAGFGGLMFAPLTRSLIATYGAAWALRIDGVIVGGMIWLAAPFMKSRGVHRHIEPSKRLNYSAFIKHRNFLPLFLLPFFVSFGYFIPFFFLSRYAVSQGMSAAQGALLIGLSNGANAFGRAGLGKLGDIFGTLNVIWASSLLSSLTCLLIWPFSQSFALLTVFAVSYGFLIGGYFALLPSAIVKLLGIECLAKKTGIIYSGLFLGHLLGTPITGLLLDQTATFLPVFLMSGLFILFGSTSILYAKMTNGDRFWMKI